MRRRVILGLVLAVTALLLVPAVASAKAHKVDVCHLNDLGEWQVNSVSAKGNALNAHLNHGDGLPGDPVPGMEGYDFDTDCVPTAVGTAFPVCLDSTITFDLLVTGLQEGVWYWSSTDGSCTGTLGSGITGIFEGTEADANTWCAVAVENLQSDRGYTDAPSNWWLCG